jgi:hypothetical protein
LDQVPRKIWAEDWEAIPEPEGKIGRSFYWRLSRVEDWSTDCALGPTDQSDT